MSTRTAFVSILALGCLVLPVLAQDAPTGEAAIEARQELMGSNAGVMGSLAELSGEEAVAAAQTLVDNFTRLPTLFPEDSMAGETRALPVIWEDWEGFEAQVAMAREAAQNLLEAAQSGDAAAFTAAVEAMGGQCGACHSTYRGPAS